MSTRIKKVHDKDDSSTESDFVLGVTIELWNRCKRTLREGYKQLIKIVNE